MRTLSTVLASFLFIYIDYRGVAVVSLPSNDHSAPSEAQKGAKLPGIEVKASDKDDLSKDESASGAVIDPQHKLWPRLKKAKKKKEKKAAALKRKQPKPLSRRERWRADKLKLRMNFVATESYATETIPIRKGNVPKVLSHSSENYDLNDERERRRILGFDDSLEVKKKKIPTNEVSQRSLENEPESTRISAETNDTSSEEELAHLMENSEEADHNLDDGEQELSEMMDSPDYSEEDEGPETLSAEFEEKEDHSWDMSQEKFLKDALETADSSELRELKYEGQNEPGKSGDGKVNKRNGDEFEVQFGNEDFLDASSTKKSKGKKLKKKDIKKMGGKMKSKSDQKTSMEASRVAAYDTKDEDGSWDSSQEELLEALETSNSAELQALELEDRHHKSEDPNNDLYKGDKQPVRSFKSKGKNKDGKHIFVKSKGSKNEKFAKKSNRNSERRFPRVRTGKTEKGKAWAKDLKLDRIKGPKRVKNLIKIDDMDEW